MCVCVYAHMLMYIYVCADAWMEDVCRFVCMCACAHARRMCACMCTCSDVDVDMNVHTYLFVGVCRCPVDGQVNTY